MKIKELIKELQKLPKENEIIITSLDDDFICNDFVVRSFHENETTQEIILPYFLRII